MDFGPDDRAQAIQVGAVLLFAMLVIAMSVYQAQVVPRENAEIEFNNYLDASNDMTVLRNDILGVAATDAQRGTTVTTGTTYPARVFFVNPGPATGRVTTGPAENISIANVKSPGVKKNVDLFLQSESSELEYSTRDVLFDPSYNEIDDEVAPVVVTNGFTYRNYSSPVPLTTQTIIKGNRLTFVTVEGELDAGGVKTPLTANPVSAHTRTITVTNRTADPLVVTVPSPIPASTWENEIIAGQMDPADTNPDRYVTSVDPGPRPDSVNITLEPGANYELRIGRIELQEKSDASDADAPRPRYLTAVTDTNVQTSRDGRVELVVEARDRYNNPVSDTNVTFDQSSDKGTFETKEGDPVSFPIKTDDEGRAKVYYNATGHLGTLPVDAWLGTSDPPADEKDVRFSVFNNVAGGSGGGGRSGEQAGRNLVVLEDTSTSATSDTFTFTVNNTGSTSVNMTGYRLDYVTKMASSGAVTDGPDSIVSVSFPGLGQTRSGTATEGRSPHFFAGNPVTIPSKQSLQMRVKFDKSYSLGNKDALVVNLAIYLEGDVTVTYTVFYIQ